MFRIKRFSHRQNDCLDVSTIGKICYYLSNECYIYPWDIRQMSVSTAPNRWIDRTRRVSRRSGPCSGEINYQAKY